MMTFDEAFDRLIGHEGGFQKDPTDRGNWTGGEIGKGELRGTKFGISAHAYPELDIKNLTIDDAKRIYYVSYWRHIIDDDVPEQLWFTLFDIAVNSGVQTARKLLQQALGVVPDGIIGIVTRTALKQAEPVRLLVRLHGYRLDAITDMRGFQHFGRGWVKRTATNLIDDFS